MSERFDLAVIGAGPGGYEAAIKAAKLGMRTALIESRELGGTCLNRGCIPTKSFLHSSNLYQEASKISTFGLTFTGRDFDYREICKRKDEVVSTIQNGILHLLEANKVTVIKGLGTILNANTILINNDEKSQITAERILIATGSKPFIPGIEGAHLDNVVTSDEMLSRETLYHKLLIIGGGVIGVEFATIYQGLGCEVEIIEAMDRILPSMDKEISQSTAMSLKRKGIKIHTKSKVLKIADDKGLCCFYEEGLRGVEEDHKQDSYKIIKSDGILLSVGRKANTENLFASDFHLVMEEDKIKVDENFETSVKGIYAVGDVIKGVQLAHVASAQGITAVERMLLKAPSICLDVIPSCIYTTPEIAAVGLTEEEAKQKGFEVITGKYPMSGNCKALLASDERSYVKVVSEKNTSKILGAQIICARATDLISEFALGIVKGLTISDMTSVIRPHPTYSEAVTEALEDINGMAIHLIPKK